MIVDLFAGPGGWDLAAADLGLHPIGIELDRATVETRAAADLATIRADLGTYDPPRGLRLDGLIASPPCQTFSSAGLRSYDRTMTDRVRSWIEGTSPGWIALENVPAAQPLFEELAADLRTSGYSTQVATLLATDYAVDQRRRRSILMASRDREVRLPVPTLRRPLSIEEVLPERRGWLLDRRQTKVRPVPSTSVAPTITASLVGRTVGRWIHPDGTVEPIQPSEIAAIQGFPPTFPWKGSRSEIGRQIGNAIPVPLAAAILGGLVR